MTERIHIFIPVYYREETVRKSAEAVLATRASDGYVVKVIFVDNRSKDSLREYLKSLEERGGVRTVLLDRNEGKARAVKMAAARHRNFDWFLSCDSDILPVTPGWPGLLVDCYKAIPRAGMVSVEYVNNGNSPMPHQPKSLMLRVRGTKFRFCWGGQVAGGCFVTEASVWHHVGYRCSGVYGGVDGLFRLGVAEALERKCGYVRGVVAEHLDDRNENRGYHRWKVAIQSKIKVLSPLAKASELGNERGYWD